jgi:hypothetical protein
MSAVAGVKDPMNSAAAVLATASLPSSFKGIEPTLSSFAEKEIASSRLPFVRQFVPAERVLRLASPRSKTSHGKARVWVLHPNGDLLRPDIYRAVFERISARAIGATKIFPGDFHVSHPAVRSSFGSS